MFWELNWDDAQKAPCPGILWVLIEGTSSTAASAILHYFQSNYSLKKQSRIWAKLSLKSVTHWIKDQTLCSVTSALNLVPGCSGICPLWCLLLAKPLPGRPGIHGLFQLCSAAFRVSLVRKVAWQARTLDIELEGWSRFKFCVYHKLGMWPWFCHLEPKSLACIMVREGY